MLKIHCRQRMRNNLNKWYPNIMFMINQGIDLPRGTRHRGSFNVILRPLELYESWKYVNIVLIFQIYTTYSLSRHLGNHE